MSLASESSHPPTESVSFELDLEHPPEKVWRALTDPELLEEWLLPAVDLNLEPGAQFTFSAPAQPGWDGTVRCRVLEIDAPGRLRYSWVVGDLETVVTFTLAPMGSGTRLSLVHSGFKPEQKRNLAGARYGWKAMVERLVALLARVQ